MTNKDLKDLSYTELLKLIGSLELSDLLFKKIRHLGRTDDQFRAKMFLLKDYNKNKTEYGEDLIIGLESMIKSTLVSDELKPLLQETLVKLKSLS